MQSAPLFIADGRLAEKVVVINLPDRTDRRARVQKMMEQEGIEFAFADGVRVPSEEIAASEWASVEWDDKGGIDREVYIRGLAGCKRAHLQCLEAAIAEGVESLLILEDDVEFRPGWQGILAQALASLPGDWWQLYFSGYSFMPESGCSRHLVQLGGAWQTTAILYSRAGMEVAAAVLRESTCEIDHWMAVRMHPAGHSYMLQPKITFQVAGFSDCRGAMREELN